MKVSRHGDDRVRERLGLPRKAVEREAAKALEHGRPRTEFSGSFRRYLDALFHQGEYRAAEMRVHNQYLFLFASDHTLITAWLLPVKWRRRKAINQPDEVQAA